jgi:hypothetical protein
MSDRCARIAAMLALAPGLTAFWLVYADSGLSNLPPALKEIRGAFLVCSGLMVLAVLLLWRRYVRWSWPRAGGTASATLLMLAHAIVWAPLWPISGCGRDEELRGGQSLASAGLWLAACAVIWWGTLLLKPTRSFSFAANGIAMTPNAARLMAGAALLPLLPGLFFVLMLALEDLTPLGSLWAATLSMEFCALVAVGAWLLLWRRAVVWTRRIIVRTASLAAILLLSPAVYVLEDAGWLPGHHEYWDVLWAVTPLFAWALWLAGTARVWRGAALGAALISGGALQIEAVARCPSCGYSLIGLHEVRCPECGWSATIDVLIEKCLGQTIAVP